MGKKNKKLQDEDDGFLSKIDHSTGFVSHKATLKKEAAEAKKGSKLDPSGFADDDEKPDKKNKRGRKGAQEDEDAFGQTADQIPSTQPDAEHDLQKDLEANFEGIAKKNTRKKKQQQFGQDDLGGAFDANADSDEMYEKKGGKGNKGKKEH